MEPENRARAIARILKDESDKTGKMSVFVITSFPREEDTQILFPAARETVTNVVGFCELGDRNAIIDVLKAVDGLVDFALIDVEKKVPGLPDPYSLAADELKTTQVLTYKDNDVWVRAVDMLISFLKTDIVDARVTIVGESNIAYKLALKAAERGSMVKMACGDSSEEAQIKAIVQGLNLMKVSCAKHSIEYSFDPVSAAADADVLIGAKIKSPTVTLEVVKAAAPDCVFIDAGIGTFTSESADYVRKNGSMVYRFDNRATLSSEILALLETRDLIQNVMGEGKIAGVPVVAGGIIGKDGTVIVDSISHPTHVIGFADGTGRVRYEARDGTEKKRLRVVRQAIGQGSGEASLGIDENTGNDKV